MMDLEKNGELKIENGRRKKSASFCLKCAAAITASITTAGFGIIMSWTSPSLPYLTSPSSHTPVSEMQGAWIASLTGCGTISGYFLNPILINRIGSKNTLLCLAVPQILSWILIYLGRNWILLCVARIIGGVGYGGGLCSTAVYLGEIGDPKTRGIFLAFIKMSINIGIFITMFFGAFLPYDAMNLALLGLPIIFVLFFFFMPDTNQFSQTEDIKRCVQKKSEENVVNVSEEDGNDFKRKNADHPEVNKGDVSEEDKHDDVLEKETDDDIKRDEINSKKNTEIFIQENYIPTDIIESKKNVLTDNVTEDSKKKEKEETVEEEMVNLIMNKRASYENTSKDESRKNIWWKLFFLKNNRKALVIIFVASLTDIFSGHMAIVSYTQQIFEYSGASLKAEYAALISAGLKICASLISTLVVERFGRRTLFLTTGILAGCAQGSVGLFFFLKMCLKIDVSLISWMPLLMVSMYEVVGSIGFSSLYYVYQGELFSDDVRGAGVTCTNVAYETVTFFIKVNFQMVIDAVGIYSVFWGFGVSCIIGSWVTYSISPETKGKSKEEIKKLLEA